MPVIMAVPENMQDLSTVFDDGDKSEFSCSIDFLANEIDFQKLSPCDPLNPEMNSLL